jgi:hypothetical protein
MPQHDHLRLVRLPERLERRRQTAMGGAPTKSFGQHSAKLRTDLDRTLEEHRRRPRPQFVDPALILRVRMNGMTMEADWERLGLTLLASDEDKTLVLFASDEEMRDFRLRLDQYGRGVPPGQVNPPYAGFMNRLEEIGGIEPRDRIGIRLREEGFAVPDDFPARRSFVLDIELWEVGRREVRERKVQQIADYVDARGGEILDRYVGPSITMLRARMDGSVVRSLLNVDVVAAIDLPPEPDAATGEAFEYAMGDLPDLEPVLEDAPVIGVIDSGMNAHPLIEDVLVGAIGVPADLGAADDLGHGTRVGGVAVFGDLRRQLDDGTLVRAARIASARVLNEAGGFHDRRLLPSQMREALSTLHARFGCRLFVISLGDPKRVFDGGKVGPWAATLDELARELDAVIVVSAGNRAPRGGNRLEQAVTEYPGYLLEPANRLCEPAAALNVLTIGSLAHGEGLDPDMAQYLAVRPITRALEPSPFTRVGLGVGGALKPDLVDVGGTLVFDPAVGRLRKGEDLPSAGVLTLHHNFLDRLFTAGSGTSYAAPLVAHRAAQLMTLFPGASANLIRALLAGAAAIPDEARMKLQALGGEALRSVCGYGRIDTARAAYSDDHRVVLYAEDELALDHFAVFQIPVPEAFQSGGRRTIRVTLAFDPPVRHTRADYAGVGMNFRLLRGCDPELVFEHYRRRRREDGRHPEIENRFNCSLEPGPRERERGSLQSASVTFTRDTGGYGDTYYLVVRCESGWAVNSEVAQRFAAVVEMTHQPEIQLYARLRGRVRLPG